MKLTSPAFGEGATLPDRFARETDNRSPPLVIADVPREAKSVALIMDDPDAPSGTFTHWIVFNLDYNIGTLHENHVPRDARLGRNDYGDLGYGGPRPPSGTHRYFFKLYALDCRLDLPEGASRADVDRAIDNHIIDRAQLMGRYSAVPTDLTR